MHRTYWSGFANDMHMMVETWYTKPLEIYNVRSARLSPSIPMVTASHRRLLLINLLILSCSSVKEDGASSDSVYSPSGLESWQFPVIGISVALFVFLAIIVLVFAYRQRLHRKLAKKEEEIREMCEQEAKSLHQSPVHRFLTVNSARSSSGSVTSDTLLRGNLVSCGDEFAHVSIPLDKKWEIDREHLRIDGELGEGAFGRVLKATAVGVPGLPPKHTVAIKTLKGKARGQEYHRIIFLLHNSYTPTFFPCRIPSTKLHLCFRCIIKTYKSELTRVPSRQTDSQTDRQTDRQADRQTGRHTDRYRQTYRQI